MDSPEFTMKSAPRGYLSEDAKRKFTIITGILGALFFFGQMIVPFVMMFGVGFMSGFEVNQAIPNRGAFQGGRLWYVSGSMSSGKDGEASHKLMAVAPNASEKEAPVEMATFKADSPMLLADGNRLWVIAMDKVGLFENGKVSFKNIPTKLQDPSAPFMYQGRPAVLENAKSIPMLMALENGDWVEKAEVVVGQTVSEETGPSPEIHVASAGNALWFFIANRNDEAILSRKATPEINAAAAKWERVGEGDFWAAAVVGGNPVVVATQRQTGGEERLVGFERKENGWEKMFSRRQNALTNVGVYPIGDGQGMVILGNSIFSLRKFIVRGGNVESSVKFSGGFPFPGIMKTMMAIQYGSMIIVPLILALILSAMMHKYRVCDYVEGPAPVPFASLSRRAVAQVVDAVFLLGPSIAAGITFMHGMSDFEDMAGGGSPRRFLITFGLMFGSFFWIILLLAGYGVMEGIWGQTPGKWLAGIKVVGTDLKPCGVGRGLLRNLLTLADGFFSFLLGILLVALTDNWQRVGDMAARTVVIKKQ